VDVAGALLEGVLPQPVDDVDDVAVVGIELAVALAQLHQLLEGREAGSRGPLLWAAFLTERARL
jgi:hypothetical protein